MHKKSAPDMRRILFVTNTVSRKEYHSLQKMHKTQSVNASQVMFGMFFSVLSERQDIATDVLSIRPIRRADLKHRAIFLRSKDCMEENIRYLFSSRLLLPGVGIAWEFLVTLIRTFFWCARYNRNKSLIICDALTLSSPVALFTARIFRHKAIAYITDIPSTVIGTIDSELNLKTRLRVLLLRFSDWTLRYYDKFVVVTEQMNKYVNPKNRPHIVVECIAQDRDNRQNHDASNIKETVVGYFGKTHKRLGIEMLVEASRLLNRTDVRFEIYGTGDYDQTIMEAALLDKRIFYGGYITHEDAVLKEEYCSLLVNLRSSHFEFTNTTFPSKLAEYMLSGVPVLTTHLAGIPKEYEPYLWFLEDESPEGAASAINNILNLPVEERKAKGKTAREFMLANKTKHAQTDRILNFIL